MRSSLYRAALVCAALGTTAGVPHAQEEPPVDRALHWPTVEVLAFLEADGSLKVFERQTLVLSGDWNGPERRFTTRFLQELTLEGAQRLFPDAAPRPMTEGDLSTVESYAFTDGVFRWRSRLPEDPPHRGDTIAYQLSYRYTGILQRSEAIDGTPIYTLAHDFGFAERPDRIERFALTLHLDSAWIAPAGFTGTYTARDLLPGAGYLVTLPLRYRGPGRPAAVLPGASRDERRAILLGMGVLLLALVGRFVQREWRLGRLGPAPVPERIDADWIRAHLLTIPPEVVGAAWDDETGPAEVAALISRLIQERKLSSRVETKRFLGFPKHVLHLELHVEPRTLEEHERRLIEGLFFGGRTRTSTEEIARHYASSGFDPASRVSEHLQRLVRRLPTGEAAPPFLPRHTGWVVALLAVGGAILAVQQHPVMLVFALPGLAILLVARFALVTAARRWQTRTHALGLAFGALGLPVLLGSAGLGWLLWTGAFTLSHRLLLAAAIGWVGIVAATLGAVASPLGRERIALKRRLAAARTYFARELRQATPALEDAWAPWLLALGLGTRMDRWFRAFGGAAVAGAATLARDEGTTAIGRTMSGGGGAGGGFGGFGGGGGFAGGGSSGSFGAALGGIAAQVSPPASSGGRSGSSSSGGGGGGGSSSGGGGGGGW